MSKLYGLLTLIINELIMNVTEDAKRILSEGADFDGEWMENFQGITAKVVFTVKAMLLSIKEDNSAANASNGAQQNPVSLRIMFTKN